MSLRLRRIAAGFSWGCSLLAALAPNCGWAQRITIDGSLSPARTLAGPNYTIGADLGRQVGGNLFHSFGKFGLNTGESANFTGPATVANIVGRVTGGDPSSIDGKIQSSIAGANLYLINPSGIVFGPSATVNVSGSFHAASADYLRMSDGARFQATNRVGSTFSAAPPAAFGFLGPTPAAITVNGSTLGPVPGVLGLTGGPVTISGAALSAPGGTIQVTSAAGSGEVPLDPAGSAPTVTAFGPVAITGGAKLAVSDPQGQVSSGSVLIRAGALSIDASEIDADNYGAGPGGQLLLQADRRITATGGATIHALAKAAGGGAAAAMLTGANGTISIDSGQVLTEADGTGAAGDITVATGNLTILNGGFIGSNTTGAGNAGSVQVTVGGPLTIDGQSASGFTGITSQTHGTGSAQAVSVDAGTLSIANSGEISGNTFGMGTGGDLTVRVRKALSLSTGGQITTDSENPNSGNAGRITVSAGSLSITTDGLISSGTFGAGSAGDVMVRVAGRLSIDGTNADPKGGPTSILSQAEMGKGNAGRVTILAGDLSIVAGGEISGDTFSAGRGGDVSVKVTGALAIANGFIIADGEAGSTGDAGNVTVKAGAISVNRGGMIASDAVGATTHKAGATGNAGAVTVSAGSLSISNNGAISSTTFGAGRGGSVLVTVSDQLTIVGTAASTLATGIEADTDGSGHAGNAIVTARNISISGNGEISSSSGGTGFSASGDGGDVFVTATGTLSIIGGNPQGSATGIFAQANPTSTGKAGDVNVTAGSLSLAANGIISSSTFGPGNAGGVSVTVYGPLTIDGASGNPALSTGIIAQTSGGGDAGSVTVSAGNLSIANNGGISSTTFGAGRGGSVLVTVSDQLTIVGTAANTLATGIEADTDGSGHAGNAIVTARNISISGNGEISSSSGGTGFSASGDGGDVFVTATGTLSIIGGNPQGSATGIFAQANPTSTGKAGDVNVTAGSLSLAANGIISSSTFGPGNAGSVSVTVYGQLTIDGASGNPAFSTGISAQTSGSGDGGSVTVSAGDLSIASNGEIASSTFGAGNGGSVSVSVAGQVTIDAASANPQFITGITAQSSGSGAAGSIELTAGRLELLDGGAISTGGLTANGGNITLSAGDLLYLRRGQITTSVTAALGNGGNILIDAQRLALDRSRITAQAVGGNGGNIAIRAEEYLPSADSVVSATSQKAISGTIEIEGPRVDLNGSLVVLPSALKSAATILREACAARNAPRSSLTEVGRGGLPEDPELAVPSLYLAGRQLAGAGAGPQDVASSLRSTLDLRAVCG